MFTSSSYKKKPEIAVLPGHQMSLPGKAIMNQSTPLFLQRKPARVGSIPDQNRVIQRKLTVGASNDEFEQEADEVVDQVMRTADSNNEAGSDKENIPLYLQRMPEPAQTNALAEGHDDVIRAKSKTGSTNRGKTQSAALPSSKTGKPLASHVRDHVEPLLGTSLSHVRVHDDAAAHEAASSINARAFTHQNDIFLGAGESENDVQLLAHESTHVVQQHQAKTMLLQRATKRRETRPIKSSRSDIKKEVGKSYWEVKVGKQFSLVYVTPVSTRFSSDKEERDAVLSVLWQNRPGAKFRKTKTGLYSIPARSGVKGAKDLIYRFIFKPKTRKNRASVEIQLVAEGSAAKVTAASIPGSRFTPGTGYHDKNYVDLELEQLQSRKKNRLGAISGLGRLPKDEIPSVKYTIWQYFKFGKVSKSELDVIIPIANSKRSVYYTLRFDAKTSDVEVERIGEAGKGNAKPDELDISRVNDFTNQIKNVTTFKSWLNKRYPGVSVSGKTVAELQTSFNKSLKSDCDKPAWFRKNYGIQILDTTSGDARMHTIHGWPLGRRTGIKDFSSSELVKLEMTLQSMSLAVLKHLKNLRLVRQDSYLKKKNRTYVAVPSTYGYTFNKGSDTTVVMFDSFVQSDKNLFAGGRAGVRSASIANIAHELGHAADFKGGLAAKFNAFVKSKGIKAMSWYAATAKSEEFPEAFAFYHADPEWMRVNIPDMYKWFETLSRTGKPPP